MSKEVMQQALEALLLRKNTGLSKTYDSMAEDAIAAIKEAIKHDCEITRLQKIEAAARNLVAQKGRHHTQQAYEKLAALLGQKLSPNDSVTY